MPVDDMNEAVLVAIEEHALTPEAIEYVVSLTERDDIADQQARLARERKDLDKRIDRLVAAIETGGDAASLVAKLRELEARRSAIASDLTSLQPVPRLDATIINNRLAEWRRLLRSSTTQARTVLQRVLRGRLTFTPRPDGSGYDFEGPTRFDKLFAGIVAPAHGEVSDLIRDARQGTERIGIDDVNATRQSCNLWPCPHELPTRFGR
jgi:hypothetical protein